MNVRPPINIETAVAMWGRDASIGEIANQMGVSRGIISGLMNRNRELFPKKAAGKMDCRSPGYVKAEPNRKRRTRDEIDRQDAEVREAKASAAAYDAERLPHAKTLMERGPRECCFPVNSGGPFLYCAAEATDGPPEGLPTYCRHHHLRMLPARPVADMGAK